ncbi:MAG TPA: FAD-dependent oxidoreductase [Trebonia sp.]
MSDALGHVFAPGAIGSLALPHRVITGAMHLGLETRDDDGAALSAFYTERARGGAGLMVTGGAAVSWAGSGGARYGVLSDSGFTRRLVRVVRDVHSARKGGTTPSGSNRSASRGTPPDPRIPPTYSSGTGGLIALQLFHAGRYAPRVLPGRDGPPVAPSPVFSRISGCEPRALTPSEITATIGDFARGAALAKELGFDAVEIMGSEGYLIDQFLSPVTNQRDDEWGGDAARRARFGVEVLRAVRASVGAEYPVIFRLTGADLVPGGVPFGEVADFAVALAAAGADALNIGIGWHEAPVPTVQAIVPPGNWVPVAAQIREAVVAAAASAGVPAIPVITSNRINRLSLADDVLAGGQADFVSMARPFLADSRLMSSARAGAPVNVCIGCNQACIDRSLTDDGELVSCMVNPRAAREVDLPYPARVTGTGTAGTGAPGADAAGTGARVAVVGGGPAGLTAARELALAGHQVSLFEADGALGGQFRLAARVPGKADYAASVQYLTGELGRLGGTVTLGRSVGKDDADLLTSFDGVVVATGVRPRCLDLPGAGLPHVISYADAFTAELGRRVVILGGGGVAVDVAHFASHSGSREVTIVHRGKRAGSRLGKSTRWAVMAAVRDSGVVLRTETRCGRITPDGVEVRPADAATGSGSPELIPADTVVIAIGQETENAAAAAARDAGVPHWVIGGARDATALDAVRAMDEGLRAAREFTAQRRS